MWQEKGTVRWKVAHAVQQMLIVRRCHCCLYKMAYYPRQVIRKWPVKRKGWKGSSMQQLEKEGVMY